jgi:hypothetical protein
MSKKNAHGKRAYDAQAEILQLCGGSDNPRLAELVELLRTHATHSYLSGLAEAHERLAGLYGFESNHHPVTDDDA